MVRELIEQKHSLEGGQIMRHVIIRDGHGFTLVQSVTPWEYAVAMYGHTTLGELYDFVRSSRARREAAIRSALKELKKRLGHKPNHEERRNSPEFQYANEEHPRLDSQNLARAGARKDPLGAVLPQASETKRRAILRALVFKMDDEILGGATFG